MTESPRHARVGTSVLFFVHGLIVSTWLSRIPAVQSALHMSAGALGLALLGTAVGALGAMMLTGALVTRMGSRPIAMGSTMLMASAILLMALAPNRWALTAALVVFGIFSGASNVSINSQAVLLEQRVGRPILSSFHALFSVGGMTGASFGGLAAAWGLRPLDHFLLAVPFYVLMCFFAGRTLLASDKGAPGQPVFAKITRPLLALGCLAFCILLNEGAMADWSSVYLRRSLATTDGTAATGYAVFSMAMAIGRLLGDRMTGHFGRVAIVRYGAMLSAVGLAAGLLTATVPATLLGFAAAGAGFSIIVPLAFGAAGRNGASAGTGLAAVNTAGYLGFLAGPAVIGFSAELVGLRSALFLVVILSVIVSLLAKAVRIPGDGEGRTTPHSVTAQEPVLQ